MEEVVAVGGESLARDLHVAAPQLQRLLQQRGLGAQLLRGVAWAHGHWSHGGQAVVVLMPHL